MDLIHYSADPIEVIYPSNPLQTRSSFKPAPDHSHHLGLGCRLGYGPFWVSDEEDPCSGWYEWCEREKFAQEKFEYKTRVELVPDHPRVLILDSMDLVYVFDERYKGSRNGEIFWNKVAKDWDAVIMSPYSYTLRMKLLWHYTWDCASGFILDPDVIESFECHPHRSSDREAVNA